MPFGAKSIFNSLITQAPAEECFKSSFNARFEKKVTSLPLAFFNDEISSIRISEFSIELNLPLI